MIPHYNYSIDCHKNMKNAYEQGAEDMRRKICCEMIDEANTTSELILALKIRNVELNNK